MLISTTMILTIRPILWIFTQSWGPMERPRELVAPEDLGGPELNLSAALKESTSSSLVYDTVNEVNDFVEQFLTHYQEKLREVFPRLVSHYMRQALKKSKLVKDYDLVIERTPLEDRDWTVVSAATLSSP
ncbi:hypothetical protein BGZ96_004038 [Linnemannia gamsii]|uniref:Uncharacterized protein n=1 Tax=Linnemannia gamsii TaxID=64522 RepID=A0ABQ7JIJ8_9FUNG|nr:hypothetical protein BGZ96_004038 [Linnemannia gamsii]